MIKKRYLFLIMLVCLFAISTVSAEGISNETNDVLSVENTISVVNEEADVVQENILNTDDVLSEKNNEWYVNASAEDGGIGTKSRPYNNFKIVLDNPNLQNGDTIYFAGGKSYVGENNTNLEFEKNLNLVKWGNEDVIFDGKYTYRIFSSYSSEMNIIGLTFINGNAKNGGALYFKRLINGNINCTFINNNALYDGGAICAGTMANINLTSTFINNKAYGDGGAIYIGSTTSDVDLNSIFINNSADHGGALYLGGVNYMDIGSTFRNNSANYGGAIFVKASVIGHLNVKSTFVDNVAYWGGAINFGDSVSSSYFNSSFINNKAFYAAGAICVMGFVSNLNIFSTFINNSASTYGGAIIFSTKVSSLNLFSTFINNSVINGYGGVIASFETMSKSTIQGIFINNTAPGSLIYCYESSDTKIINSIFLNNAYDSTMFDIREGRLEANGNWFGNNASNYKKKPNVGDNVSCDSWLFLDATGNYLINGKANVIFNLNNLYDSSFSITTHPSTSKLPKCYFNLYATNGNLNKNSTLSGESVTFVPSGSDNMGITAKCEDASYSVIIYKGKYKIDADDVTKYYGGSERFVVTVKDKNNQAVVGGDVTIILNGQTYTRTTDGNGEASMAINLNAGFYEVIVKYADINVTSSITIIPTVFGNDVIKMYKDNTQYYATFLDSEGNYLAKGTYVEFNLDSYFYTQSIIDNKGRAKLDINNKPGEYIITAKNPISGEMTTNNITVLSNIVENHDSVKYYNESDKFSVRILSSTGSPASGQKVKFTVGDNTYERTSDSQGYAVLNAQLQPGTYIVKTTYGDLEVNNTIVILPTLSDNDMQVSSSDINAGENEVIKVVLPDDVTGKISTIINNKEYSANVNNGVGNIVISGLKYGTYNVEVTYSGDSQYNSVKGKTSFMVDTNIELSASDLTKYYRGAERFIVTVKEDNKPVIGKNVTIYLNGATYTRTTNENGEASMAINLNSGTYKVTSEFEGIEVQSTITVKSTVSGNNITKIFRNGTQYYATFVDTSGILMKNTDVNFNINGVFYTRTTNDKGVARMNINLNPGEYIITAKNPVTGEQYTNIITVLPSIVEVHDLTKYYKNASKLTFKLLDEQGRPVGAGVNANININGVFYTRQTNASGYVNMNINLNPGTYIATLEYNGLMASSTVKVLPILEAKDVVMEYKDGTKFEAKLLDGQGRPFAGQTITFNINGVFYDRITDNEGIARLSINLMPGTYVITSMYSNGAAISNNIVINEDPNWGYEFISLPSYDTITTAQLGIYKIEVHQWRSPGLGEVDILVYDSNGNTLREYNYDSKISDGTIWSGSYSTFEYATYHKWQFTPDVRITQVAVKIY